jgi:hypothetical protein
LPSDNGNANKEFLIHDVPVVGSDSSSGDCVLAGGQAKTDNQETVMTGLEEVVNDIAFRFWKCSRCLGMDHQLSSCTNKIRCRGCYRYGHKEKNCFNKAGAALGQWIPKRVVSSISTLNIPKLPLAGSTSDTRQNPSLPPLSPLSQNESPPLSSQQPPPADLLHSAMAVFKLDPTPWLQWGHQVIDGGDTRLSRSFYNPMSDPPLQDQDSYIAIVDPALLAIHEGHWRDRVRDFLVHNLNCQVITYQPCVFGLGLYQMSSPRSREALVQHGPFHIEHNVFVRFINPDAAPENFRSVQGFRTGWLMFLGIPPAYHNDYDIANAVSTFGKFHYWIDNDPFKCRALVYASFPSPTLVPRDVVFGKYATVGGVRVSWMAALYILSAEFADALPADEDQMPPDGNPHPLPGQLVLNPNMFVAPQFPEIGWDFIQQQEVPQ